MWTGEEKAQSLKTVKTLYSLISSLESSVDAHTPASLFPFYVHLEKKEVRCAVYIRDFYEDCYCSRAKKEFEGGYFVERDGYYPIFNMVRVSLDEETKDPSPSLLSIGTRQMWVQENQDTIAYAGVVFSSSGSFSEFQHFESFARVVAQTILDATGSRA